MSAYATNDDLLDYIPTIFDHGVESFTDDLTRATTDVQRYVEINWYNKNFPTGVDRVGQRIGAEFDASRLNADQWKRSVIYLALYAFILPRLSPFRIEGDSFQEQISFYKNRYMEEVSASMAQGVQYDMDGDETFAINEKYRHRRDRLYR